MKKPMTLLLGIFSRAVKTFKHVCSRPDRTSSGRVLNVGRIPELEQALVNVAQSCTLCAACQKQCSFLQKYGLPGEMARALLDKDSASGIDVSSAFECSLCELCSSLCPEKLGLYDLFLAMRRNAAEAGALNEKRYALILNYEKRGNSRTFSWYGLPEGCDTVFFPGCALPGTRPEATFRLYESLSESFPNLGVVLDCCNKPSHDLGRHDHFEAMFSDMCDWLTSHGVARVLVACPNCTRIFNEYGNSLEVSSVWEIMAGNGLPVPVKVFGEVTIHDPCPLRQESGIHEAVRTIVDRVGLTIHEMRHKKKNTFCCGEGGFVGFVSPETARAWGERRAREAGKRQILTYCAGCAGYLGRKAQVGHLADLVFWPQQTVDGAARPSRAPFTYLNRLRLKKRFQKRVPTARSRVRTFRPQGNDQESSCHQGEA
jgi:Fe-S oxidoreductase